MRESSTKFSLSHINISKLVNLLTSALFFHSLHIVVLVLLFISPLVALLSLLVLKFQTFCHSIILLLFCGIVSHLTYVTLHIMSLLPSLILNPPVSDRSTALFLKKLKTLLFHFLFLLSLYSAISQD